MVMMKVIYSLFIMILEQEESLSDYIEENLEESEIDENPLKGNSYKR